MHAIIPLDADSLRIIRVRPVVIIVTPLCVTRCSHRKEEFKYYISIVLKLLDPVAALSAKIKTPLNFLT